MRTTLFAAAAIAGATIAGNATGAITIIKNEGAFTSASVIDLTATGNLGWLSWKGAGNPSGNQVQKASPTTPITFSEVRNGVTGTYIPNNNTGGWSSLTAANIDRSWSDGNSPTAGSAGDTGPYLNKYDPAAQSPPIYLRFDIDVSTLYAGFPFEASFYFATQAFDVALTAEQLDLNGQLITGETASATIGNGTQSQEYSSFDIETTLAMGAQKVRLTVLADDRGGPNHNFRISSVTVAPEPGSIAFLAAAGMLLVRRRR